MVAMRGHGQSFDTGALFFLGENVMSQCNGIGLELKIVLFGSFGGLSRSFRLSQRVEEYFQI